MKRLVSITVLLALIALICSCGKSTCLNPGFRVTFNGFDSLELSRVLIQQYISNGNFTTLVSVRVYDTANIDIVHSNDTTYFPRIDTSGAPIAPGYDYIVAVPSVTAGFFSDSVFKITKLSYTQITHSASKSGSGGCTNNASYYLDTIPHKVTGGSFAQSVLPPVRIVLNK